MENLMNYDKSIGGEDGSIAGSLREQVDFETLAYRQARHGKLRGLLKHLDIEYGGSRRYKEYVPPEIRKLAEDNNVPLPNRYVP